MYHRTKSSSDLALDVAGRTSPSVGRVAVVRIRRARSVTLRSAIMLVAMLVGTGLSPPAVSRALAAPSFPDRDYNKAFITDAQYEAFDSMSEANIREFLKQRKSWLSQPVPDTDGTSFDAAKEIAAASREFRISPKILLTTMQKENSAVTKQGDYLHKLMGCNPPSNTNTARQQIQCSARALRNLLDVVGTTGSATSPVWRVGQTTLTQDGVAVTPVNRAVAAQFAYTPYAGSVWAGKEGGVALFYSIWSGWEFGTPIQPPKSATGNAGQRVRLLPATSRDHRDCYSRAGNPAKLVWDGKPIYLTADQKVRRPFAVDDTLTIFVQHMDDDTGVEMPEISSLTLDVAPMEVSAYLHPGENLIMPILWSTTPPICGSGPLWLVSANLLTDAPVATPPTGGCSGKTPTLIPAALFVTSCTVTQASQWLRATIFRDSDADIALVAPDGTTYNQDSPGAYFERDDAQVTITVYNPLPGDWGVSVTGRETDQGGTSFDYLLESLLPWNDNVAPSSSAQLVCSRDALGVCRSEAFVQLSAIDQGNSGQQPSGIDRIDCSFDGGTTWRWCGDSSGGQVILGSNSIRGTEFVYRATDRARNVETTRATGLVPVERHLVSTMKTGQSWRMVSNTTLKLRGARSFTAGSVYVVGNTGSAVEQPVEITSGGNTVSSNTNTTFTSVGAVEAVTAPAYKDAYWLGIANATYSSGRTFTAASPASGVIVITSGDAIVRAVNGPTTVVALDGSVSWQLPAQGSVVAAAAAVRRAGQGQQGPKCVRFKHAADRDVDRRRDSERLGHRVQHQREHLRGHRQPEWHIWNDPDVLHFRAGRCLHAPAASPELCAASTALGAWSALAGESTKRQRPGIPDSAAHLAGASGCEPLDTELLHHPDVQRRIHVHEHLHLDLAIPSDHAAGRQHVVLARQLRRSDDGGIVSLLGLLVVLRPIAPAPVARRRWRNLGRGLRRRSGGRGPDQLPRPPRRGRVNQGR